MQEVEKLGLTQMAELNNSVISLVDSSKCTVLEVIAVLRIITSRLDKSFELSVMGNPVSNIAAEVRRNGDKEA